MKIDVSEYNKPLNEQLTTFELNVVNVLYDRRAGMEAGSFTAALIEAIAKADLFNKAWIYEHEPELVDAVNAWQMGNLYQRWEHQYGKEGELNGEDNDSFST